MFQGLQKKIGKLKTDKRQIEKYIVEVEYLRKNEEIKRRKKKGSR